MAKMIPVTDPTDRGRTIHVNADAVQYLQQEAGGTRIFFQNGGAMDVKETAAELVRAINGG
jgi:hypothetical protein